jgi:hypothetical protein
MQNKRKVDKTLVITKITVIYLLVQYEMREFREQAYSPSYIDC